MDILTRDDISEIMAITIEYDLANFKKVQIDSEHLIQICNLALK